MRPTEFSNEQIIKAGEDLLTVGRNITGFALRQKVGGGNPSRLKQVWDEHLASKSVTRVEPVAELPVEVAEEVATVSNALTERIKLLAVGLNDKAVKAAERRVAEVIRTAGEQREQAERELADASQTVDDLENKLDESRAENERLKKSLEELQALHQAQAVEFAQVRERLSASELHATELVRTHATIEVDRVRYQLEAAAAREEAAKLSGQVEALQAQNADLMRVVGDWHKPA